MLSPIILGIDEVGRGPWAGPLVVGAVILGDTASQPSIAQLTDSKKLTPKKREKLNVLILEHAAATSLGWVSAAELDKFGLSASLKLATRRAVKQILAQKVPFSEIIIDGTVNFLQNTPLEDKVTTLPKADALIREVSAASIIAKVARDAYMAQIALQQPAYGFEKHMGYGTALHQKALQKHGICPEHRQSFRPVREIIAQMELCSGASRLTDHFRRDPVRRKIPKRSTTTKGKIAENAVARHLQSQNHTIIAHNFKTKTYEIDLITTSEKRIFFTEVKYSLKLALEGTPLVRITPEKQRQMRYAAEKFLASHPCYANFQPLLAVASVSGANYHVTDWFILD